MPAHELRTLKTKRGDCEDFAYLIMKMCELKGVETLLYTINTDTKGHSIAVYERDGLLYHGGNFGLKGPFEDDDLIAKSIYFDYNKITKRNIKLKVI
jgi:hypothetical protein